MATIDEIVIGDPPDAWESAGFAVDDDAICRLGRTRLRLVGAESGRGIVDWSWRDLPDDWSGDLDGLPMRSSSTELPEPATHPNGALAIDHVVVLSPDVDRTVAALAAVDVPPRRERATESYGAPMRQVFFRLGEVVLELVGPDAPEHHPVAAEAPSGFFGIAVTVADLDVAVGQLGARVGAVKDAVQPGRRITTLRHRELGMSVATALMSPPPR